MRVLDKVCLRLRSLTRRANLDREPDEEFRFHLDQLVDENMAAGMTADEARIAAIRAIGGISQFQEECRDMRRTNYIHDGLQDLRYAGRNLLRSRGFSCLAVLIMALAIGANTAVFSLVNQILLHPPGVSEPQRIVVVRTKYSKLNVDLDSSSPPALADGRTNKQMFEHAGAARAASFNYSDRTAPIRLAGAEVSAGWFDVFSARPILGRLFSADEDQPKANRVVVLGHDAWQRLFGGDPAIIGRTVELNQQPYEIIGVMGRFFHQPRAVDLWVPLALPPAAFAIENWFNGNISVFAGIRPGISFSQS